MKQEFEQRFILESDRSAVIAPIDRMRDAISFVAIEKMDAGRIANQVFAAASPFDEEASPRKDQDLPRGFLFRAERRVGRTATPIGDRHERAAKQS